MIPKPGHKTTEALATLAATIGYLTAALAGHLSPRAAAFATAISVGAYSVSRGLTKLGAYVAVTPSAPPAPAPSARW